MLTGYKVAAAHNGTRVIVTLSIPADAKHNMNRPSVVNKYAAKFRTNKALVLNIEDEDGNQYTTALTAFFTKNKLTYKVGKVIEEPYYEMLEDVVCGPGIHFVLSRRVAELYGKNGCLNGFFEEWDDDGRIKYQANYKDGNLLDQTFFYENGKPGQKNTVFEDGSILHEEFHTNGICKSRGTLKNNKPHGLCEEWCSSGVKILELEYVHGVRHGVFNHWYPNGQLHKSRVFTNDRLLNQVAKTWYDNGVLKQEIHYNENGREHGISRMWHKNGVLQCEMIVTDGKWVEGDHCEWDEEGILISKISKNSFVSQPAQDKSLSTNPITRLFSGLSIKNN